MGDHYRDERTYPASTSRRITPESNKSKEDNKLKAIAGLLRGLTYSEMTKLSDMLDSRVQTAISNNYPAILLNVAEQILSDKGTAS